ncbi:AAA family ATPase [Paenarthrobacter ilicis]|uniref:AAA family ATPase n=1 Tax=Paenarthrobacter ilicis TaxID=43665 RepID=UPI00386402AA
MRIHRLEIEAFGPFADAQHIDFDQLSAQGLFLLNGATGAGKTSILDAICFALYGSVPGARQDGKRLRSDHASPGAEPSVVCEFSARGRRFEVSRSPAWFRPSSRGRNGFTEQKAKTLLREWVDGAWEEKTSRNDEAGAELAGILGMDRDQFTRVVMLPQGDFAAFLRSKAGDRLELLKKLFGTQRFEAVEGQLARQAAAAALAVKENASELRVLLERVGAERAHLGLGGPGPGDSPEPATSGLEPGVWLAAVEQELTEERNRRQKQSAQAEVRSSALAGHYQAEQEKSLRHSRLAAAMQRRVLLELAAPQAQENKERLARHRRAAVLGGHLDAAAVSAGKYRSAVDAYAAATRKLEEAGGVSDDPAGALESIEATTAVLHARLPDEQRMEQIAARIRAQRKQQENSQKAAESSEATLGELAAEATAIDLQVKPLETVAGQLADREREAHAASELVDIVARCAETAQEVDRLGAQHVEARGTSQDLRQKWLDIRESRLANAAGELAAALQDGQPCAVCGSEYHPRPAAAAVSALALAQEEDAARSKFDSSDEAVALIANHLSTATARLAGLKAQSGSVDAAEADSRLAEARAAASAAKEASRSLAGLLEQRDTLARSILAAQDQYTASTAEASRAGAALVVLEEQHNGLADDLKGLRGIFPDLRSRIDALGAERALLKAVVDAGRAQESAKVALDEANLSLADALPDSGFASAEEARNELLSTADEVVLERDVAEFDAEAARLDELFANEDLVLAGKEAGLGELPLTEDQLAAAKDESAAAARDYQAAALAEGLAAKSTTSVMQLRRQYQDLAAAGEEPQRRARLLQELADTARGSGDNSYRMSLNSYVLAARLEQVAEAASERLTAMSDGRYTLQHTDAKAARGAKSGLGLEVVDEWTGQQRDTSTLSGGESFMASLSLALGLADVVQQEAGGVDIETLFVDEGFGSLDEQALEQVMDALEGLRDGGRVVGLVSHVAEMKQRIGTQLQVVKGRNGSSVRIAESVPG